MTLIMFLPTLSLSFIKYTNANDKFCSSNIFMIFRKKFVIVTSMLNFDKF